MCILNEQNERKEKQPTTFYAWKLINGKKQDFLTIKSYDTKENIKKMLREASIDFDGVDMVK